MDCSVDSGFTYPNFAGNIEFKMAIPAPLKNFAFGVSLEYNIIAIRDMKLTTEALTKISSEQDDITDLQVISLCAFLEYRFPIQIDTKCLVPYAGFGIGFNVNINDNTDLIEVQDLTVALLGSVGAEYYISKHVSIFVEPRWYYNESDVIFTPYGTGKIEGTVDLSNITFLAGINFYFGVGSTL